jgi:hypothetical protein
MKKTAIAALAAAAATTVAGAVAIQPGAATTDAKTQTMHLRLHQLTTHRIGKFDFAGTDVARRNGNVVGYDAITGHFYVKQNRAVIQVSFALKGGIISAKVHTLASQPNHYAGRILNGTGKYRGIGGTLTAQSPSEMSKKTSVTLHYHF